MKSSELPVQEYRDVDQNAEANHNRNSNHRINYDSGPIGFSCFAIVLSLTSIALHELQQ